MIDISFQNLVRDAGGDSSRDGAVRRRARGPRPNHGLTNVRWAEVGTSRTPAR